MIETRRQPGNRRRRRVAGLALLVCACSALITVSTHASLGQRPPVRGSRSVSSPAGRVALGVNLAQSPSVAALDAFARTAGVRPKILMWYQTWDAPLIASGVVSSISGAGTIPMISWDPVRDGVGVPLSSIAAGDDDAYIRTSAELARAAGVSIYVRFAHEMNLPGSPFGPGQDGNTPAIFVAAWRHVVSIFRQEGATNVSWVFSPNVYCEKKCPFTAFYPGDAWVDWVALDGYNYATVHQDPWMSFADIFGPSYAILTHLSSKPLMFAETASAEAGGDKAAWIRAIAGDLQTDFPRARALVWFDRDKEADWRVNSSPAALAAFRALVSAPPFSH